MPTEDLAIVFDADVAEEARRRYDPRDLSRLEMPPSASTCKPCACGSLRRNWRQGTARSRLRSRNGPLPWNGRRNYVVTG